MTAIFMILLTIYFIIVNARLYESSSLQALARAAPVGKTKYKNKFVSVPVTNMIYAMKDAMKFPSYFHL
jgi:hypothetical protein